MPTLTPDTRYSWIDLRETDAVQPIVEEALHAGVTALVSDDPGHFDGVPSSIQRVLLFEQRIPDGVDLQDVDVVVAPEDQARRALLDGAGPDLRVGTYVDVADSDDLDRACASAQRDELTVIRFRDPTKIPLEIVLAAGASGTGSIITMAGDLEEAEIIYGVLEHGSDGVLLPAGQVGDATALSRLGAAGGGSLDLVELTVAQTRHVGMGERVCVDTCSYFGEDEGILVGSTSKGMMLCVSETHPLPYMPTRPFRVNAGGLHSYTLGEGGRTRYLSELRSGDRVTAVTAGGDTRLVTVGRVKIESRPLISVDAVGPDGEPVNLILQHDWHVRVLGPGAEVLNSTELRPGHRILGHLPTQDRHVGYPIDEFCREQ